MRNKKEYSSDWNDIIRPDILKRDKYRCVKCGIKHKQWIAKEASGKIITIDKDEKGDYERSNCKVYRIFLHVCHRDNNKKNNDYSNLISLCVTHHAELDGSYKAFIRKGSTTKRQMNIFDIITQATPAPAQKPTAPLGSFGSHHG